MASLETKYLGLTLKSPIIVSSSGLTSNIKKIIDAEKNGAGAIVLKSVFEEQINYEANYYQNIGKNNAEAFDYLQGYVTANNIEHYLNLIKEAKANVSIPVIASVNCFTDKKWIDFTKAFTDAGADALELNIYLLPDDRKKSSSDYEKIYFNIIKKVIKGTKIPVSVKLSSGFTNVINMVDNIKGLGAKGVVLFNRLYEPDIDIEKLEITSAPVFSTSDDIRASLRWTAILSDQVKGIDLSASTGIHNAEDAIKLILAGATTVQLCSVLYNKGMSQIKHILDGISEWMERRGFENMDSIRGLMSYKSIPNPAFYHRSQFMKYFSAHE